MTRTDWLETVESDVPARLDRLQWCRWHWVVACALGLTWILDGLEATIVGSVAARLTSEEALDFTTTDVGLAASVYLAGGACGALLFGWLNDRIGRRRTFLLTLSLYLLGTLATASAFSFWSFALFRFVTGLGIGGEYVAINTTIGELVPARRRGWAYIAVNGSWWLGATFGAALSLLLLEPGLLPPDVGWRVAFVGGGVLGIGILLVRRHVPESPRWLLVHGRAARADTIVGEIEQRVGAEATRADGPPSRVRVRQRYGTPIMTVLRTVVGDHRRRALLALALMASQAFFYNAVFYTHGIVLTDFYGVTPDDVGLHLAPLALANFVGAVTLGALFDSWGRRPMLALTYAAAGAGLAALSFLFRADALTLVSQTIAWGAVFLFASAAASAAYLTVAEIFPVEIRGLAFALFYAISAGAGGVSGPSLFGLLLSSEQRDDIFIGYLIAAGLMLAAAAVALVAGVRAERRSLEEVAPPLGSHGGDHQAAADVSTATMVP